MDGDMSAFRVWQKQYDKLNRQWQAVQERYQKARQTTEQVHRNAKQLEEMGAHSICIKDMAQGRRKEAAQILKDWKRLQNGFDHEFLISKEDREFHSTYDTIVRLGIKAVDKEDQKLILQSEVENLIALLEENLEKKQPSAWKLCFFTLNHGEQELMELPPVEKLNCIDNTYQKEFLQPIIALLVFAIDRADARRETFTAATDRKSRKLAEATAVLDNRQGNEDTLDERAKRILGGFVEVE